MIIWRSGGVHLLIDKYILVFCKDGRSIHPFSCISRLRDCGDNVCFSPPLTKRYRSELARCILEAANDD